MEIRELSVEDADKMRVFYQTLAKSSRWVLFEENEDAYNGIQNYIARIKKSGSMSIVSVVGDLIVGHITGEISHNTKKRHFMVISTGVIDGYPDSFPRMYNVFSKKTRAMGIHKLECSVIETNH